MRPLEVQQQAFERRGREERKYALSISFWNGWWVGFGVGLLVMYAASVAREFLLGP